MEWKNNQEKENFLQLYRGVTQSNVKWLCGVMDLNENNTDKQISFNTVALCIFFGNLYHLLHSGTQLRKHIDM